MNTRPLKGVQHFNSGFALLPVDADPAAMIIEKASEITASHVGKVEKAEKWLSYVLNYGLRSTKCIDGFTLKATLNLALEDTSLKLVFSSNKRLRQKKAH